MLRSWTGDRRVDSLSPLKDWANDVQHHFHLLEVLPQLPLEEGLQELILRIFNVEGSEHYVDHLPVSFLPSLVVSNLIGLFLNPDLFQNFCQVEVPLLEKQFQGSKELYLNVRILLSLNLCLW